MHCWVWAIAVRRTAGESHTCDLQRDCDGGVDLREELAQQLDPDVVMVHPDGAYELWYGDGGIFWGRSIKVTGTLAGGPAEAVLEE